MDLVVLRNNDNKKYGIFQFMKMSEDERSNLKGQIKCDICGANAFYRKESRNGRKACFCAKHIGTCDNGTLRNSASDEADEETNEIELDLSSFKIRWNYKKSITKDENLLDDEGVSELTKNNKKYTKRPTQTKHASISLLQILNYAEADILDDQEIFISIDDHEIELSDLVFKFSEVNNFHINQEFFFWGEFKSLNENFINLRGCSELSILIDKEVLEKFNERHKNTLIKVIKKNRAIVFGKVIKTKSKKYLIILNDVNQIYFKKKSK